MMRAWELLQLFFMSRDEATLNSEEIKPIALAFIRLRLSEGISQSDGQSVRWSVSQIDTKSQSVEKSVK